MLTPQYYALLKSWLRTIYIATQYSTQEREIVRSVWGIPNNPHWVIVELDESLDISPILGSHFPREFQGHNDIPADKAILVFEYNYSLCGHPSIIRSMLFSKTIFAGR